MIRKITFILLVLTPVLFLHGAEPIKKAPKEAKSRDELLSTFGRSIGFGSVERAEFSRSGCQIIVIWYDPFSGRASSFLHAYYYDPSAKVWRLFMDRFIEADGDLSAELPAGTLIIRGSTGKIVAKESIVKLPHEKWYEKP